MAIFADQIVSWVATAVWPFARVTGVLMVAPVFGARFIPMRVRVSIALAFTFLILPILPTVAEVSPFSWTGLVIVVQQMLIGLAMGFILQLVFDAMVLAGQFIAMSIGLGFAFMVDPQRGINVPVLSQFYLLSATLLFLAMNGHLALVEVLVTSFTTLPVGVTGLSQDGYWQVVLWAQQIFVGSVKIALPVLASMLLVNLAFGIISRAAPTLNLFNIGFPAALLFGFVLIFMSLPAMAPALRALLDQAHANIAVLIGGAG
ncbi:MAG: flagellar biosynthetic protein FliR [Gammaproteobacteria bacterium]|nr:flagellar biosynthetic protein FliR [Gammaproteobacteria bacterium]